MLSDCREWLLFYPMNELFISDIENLQIITEQKQILELNK